MKLEPTALPETQPFWDGADAGKLVIQQCHDCSSHYFPPAPICPKCSSRDTRWVEASGEATLYSYVLTNAPWPHWKTAGPMSVALVALKEGPRLISTVVGCEQTPENLRIDMPLTATWRAFGDRQRVLCFEPKHRDGA